MKKLMILVSLLVTNFAFSADQVKMQEFSKSLAKDIDTVLENNPQIYEIKPTFKRERGPASVIPSSKVEEKERYKEKYDKNLGLKTW